MPGSPKLVLDEDVVRFVIALPAASRRRLLIHLEYLQSHSFESADFQEQDASGRLLSVRAFRPFMITYWSDGPVDELRVVDVQKVR